jgi:cysteine sulfinate desulfinase/cysteine desulfurase-like protein
LAAIGVPSDHAHVRLTCGRDTAADDVDRAVTCFAEAVGRLRDAGGGFV